LPRLVASLSIEINIIGLETNPVLSSLGHDELFHGDHGMLLRLAIEPAPHQKPHDAQQTYRLGISPRATIFSTQT
jgi:hypothetical protein